MKKIIFIADIFREHYLGGGECNDDVLINYLLSQDFEVEKVLCRDVTTEKLDSGEVFIVGNFTQLSPNHRVGLLTKKYIIYEHDHKYVTTRDPSAFKDFKAPDDKIINKEFYKNASAVVVLSKICKEVIEKNLCITNVYNIGCSLWSDEKLEYIQGLVNTPKDKKYALIASPNPVKGFLPAKKHCDENNLEYDIIQPCGEKDLLKQLARYEVYVFFPQVLETFCRLATEAKMLNCKVLTRTSMLGLYSEECHKLSGEKLIEDIYNRRSKAYALFVDLIEDINE
tara:strand:- start:19038 stop:19886 length:849 start_codon:yes stop_codon:yes gene_type:complete